MRTRTWWSRMRPVRRDERGDVPGWVLITLMTAGLVIALWAVAGPALAGVFEQAISSDRSKKDGGNWLATIRADEEGRQGKMRAEIAGARLAYVRPADAHGSALRVVETQ